MTLVEEELVRWGRRIGQQVRPPLFLALDGPLGAGKSVLARSIARGAGVSGSVPSPTYTLVQSYAVDGERTLVHMDLYRIEDPDELIELGWDDILVDPSAIVVVEWADRAPSFLPEDRWVLRLEPVSGAPDRRRVEWERVGSPHELPLPDVEGA